MNESVIHSISDLTQDNLITSIQWISKMSSPERWNLNDAEVATLLGGITFETYQDMQHRAERGLPITMTPDTAERLSLLLRIWKGLNFFVPHQRKDLAFQWFSKPTTNPTFKNKSIKDFLLESNTIESFCEVITYLRAQH